MTQSDAAAHHADHSPKRADAAAAPELYGLIGEFDDVTAVMRAAEQVRDAGYKRFDVHSPFPIHGIDEAMGTRPTILPWIVLAGGITGAVTGTFLTHYTMGVTPEAAGVPEALKGYQYFISGKPLWSTPAFIPPIFELTILFSAFGAVFGMFLLNKLPMLAHPLRRSRAFDRVTSDRFFVAIEARDAKFDEQASADLLRRAGALNVEAVTE